jgi:hypothetical protein
MIMAQRGESQPGLDDINGNLVASIPSEHAYKKALVRVTPGGSRRNKSCPKKRCVDRDINTDKSPEGARNVGRSL